MPRAAAIFNLQRVLSLVHALQHRDYGRIREAVRDRWHQPARAELVPLLSDVLEMDAPEVLGAFLSGAGPSVAAIARVQAAPTVQRLITAMYARAQVEATVRILSVHEGASSGERGLGIGDRGTGISEQRAGGRGRAV